MSRPLDIGNGLVAARRVRRISQRELGEKVGVVQQQIARWEACCYRTATLERVDAVARVLKQQVSDPCEHASLVAAEETVVYGVHAGTTALPAPVRDLGEIAARIRVRGGEIRERFGIERIGVFGSFACGAQGDSSDVDLLVDMPDPGGLLFMQAAEFVEDILGRKVDFLRPQGLTNRLRDRVLESVVYVWTA